jgi:glutamine synthetase
MELPELIELSKSGQIDTVIVAMTDMQGRLQGKRFEASFFCDEVAAHGTEACNYLLAVDMDMNTVDGYQLTSWDRGYGDFLLRPDLATATILGWRPDTVFCHADVLDMNGRPVAQAPRYILMRQLARLAETGFSANVGTELEFIAFQDTYEEAHIGGYRGLRPVNQYNSDYSILGTSRVENLLHAIRTGMQKSSMRVESVKGECNLGQHEIAFKYRDALGKADEHVLYKLGAKEIAASLGHSLTFMAKFNAREGNSCHIHFSLVDLSNGKSAFAGEGSRYIPGASRLMDQVLAGIQSTMADFVLFYAPNVNSYKRYAKGSFAPTAIAWGLDNRTCSLRVVGHGESLRIENRSPGGDVNPYLAIAAMVAGALYGIENDLDPGLPETGNAYTASYPRLPDSIDTALKHFEKSSRVVAAFGQEVADHYANMARVELETFKSAVTDWELERGFERT